MICNSNSIVSMSLNWSLELCGIIPRNTGETLYWERRFLVIVQFKVIEPLIPNHNSTCNQTTKFRKLIPIPNYVLQYLHPNGV